MLALRELYKQDLIEANVYVKKTELIAHSIIKVTGKDVSELITEKKDIYAQLKSDIKSKAKSIKLDSEKKILINLLVTLMKKFKQD